MLIAVYLGPISNTEQRVHTQRLQRESRRQPQSHVDVSAETISPEAVLDSSLQRANFNPLSVEREVVRGSMVRVASHSAVHSLRLF
jgi:hypothetical protein